MSYVDIAAQTGEGTKRIDRAEVSRLERALAGRLITAGDPEYESARQIWNAMIDKRPALIARCRGVEDVQHTVSFVRKHGLLLSIRGAGHNIAGSAVSEGGVMLDFSDMRAVTIDPQLRTARVEAGSTLADFDRAAQAYGLATPLGINSTTGIAGLTLGGGFGWLTRKHGMTVDNLIGADLVGADGRLLRASEQENPNLFWALRGGGGNFGAVTHFEYRLHPVGPELLSGLIVYSADQARPVLQRYRAAAAELSDETSAWVVMRKAPPLPFLKPEVHGHDVVVIALLHAGDVASGERAFQPFRELGQRVGEHIGVQPYAAWQQTFDPLLTTGARNYWKSHNFEQLDDGLFDVLIAAARRMPTPHSEMLIAQMGGAANRVAAEATAYPHRDVRFVVNVHGRWLSASDDEAGIAWSRAVYRDAAPFATGGAYVNFLSGDENDRIRVAYGNNLERLRAAKQQYDRDNLFSMNHNIPLA